MGMKSSVSTRSPLERRELVGGTVSLKWGYAGLSDRDVRVKVHGDIRIFFAHCTMSKLDLTSIRGVGAVVARLLCIVSSEQVRLQKVRGSIPLFSRIRSVFFFPCSLDIFWLQC